MAEEREWPVIPTGKGVPLVDMTTYLFPIPTMDALGELFPAQAEFDTVEQTITEGRLSEPELNATIGVATAGRSVRPALHALGDSLSANGLDRTRAGIFANSAQNPWVWAMLLSQGRLPLGTVGATGGHRTDQIIADHLATVVAAIIPGDFVAVLAGTNDVTQAIALATIKTNLTAMYDAVAAAGGIPVACSIPPRDTDDATLAGNRLKLNMWIEQNARARGIPFLDFYLALADPAQLGKFTVGLNTDATHPNGPGAKVMGQLAADRLTPLDAALPYLAAFTSGTATDSTGATLMGNACMVTDSNANSVPDQFNTLGGTLTGGSGYALSTVAGIPGKVFAVTRGATGPNNVLAQTSPSSIPVTPGQVIEMSFRVKFDIAAGNPDLSPSDNAKMFCHVLSGDGASFISGLYNWDTPLPWSVFTTRFVMPDLPTDTLMFNIAARDAECTASIAQLTIRNLTALGLA